jgi:hypothetical protein
MLELAIGARVRRDRRDSEFAAGPQYTQGDLTTICDDHFVQHDFSVRYGCGDRSQRTSS